MSSNPNSPAAQSSEPIAIIGIGCLFPGSDNRNAYWANIRDGIDLIEEIPESHWSPSDYHDINRDSPDRTYGKRGGFITPVPFRPLEFGIAPRDLEATDTSQLLSLIAARQALSDAGYDPQRTFDRNRASVILGVTGALELVIPLGARLGHPQWWKALLESGVDEDTASEVVRRISDSYVSWQENSFPGLLGNVVAGRIANRLDLHGTNCVTDAACASSLAAMHLASLELRSGRSDMVVTGGVDTFNDIFMYMCFSKTPALSPTGDARPFDHEGDGTILGEGIGLVVLKRLSDAIRDGDRIYARLLSIGTSSDGKGSAIYAPTAAGQQRALQEAYELASVSPSTIELVEAHGTGTAVGDATELQALQEVYLQGGSEPAQCALGSVKSQIGHTKAAAGAAGLIKAVLALHHKVQPPSIKIREPLKELREERTPFHIESTARPWVKKPNTPRRAAISSFGFGGSNFHAVLEENSPGRTEIDWNGSARIIAFSDSSTDKLKHQLQVARSTVEKYETQQQLDSFARDTRARFQHQDEHRLTIIHGSGESITDLLDDALKTLKEELKPSWNLPSGIDRGSGRSSGSLAILFPGQGSQRVDMLRSACCRFPQMMQVVDDGESAFWAEQGQAGLASRIWPQRSWDSDDAAQQLALRTTDVAQPAIGAVSLGLYRVLGQFGIEGDLLGGHSFGELTALAASGRLGETDFHQLANFRGRLMAQAGGSNAGSMLAVALPLQELDRFVAEHCPRLVIANRNAPKQAVLSGSDQAIGDAIRILDQRGIRNQKLPVAAAFHSPEVASAAEPFLEVLQRARFHHSVTPVLANSTGKRYPDLEEEARTTLAHQIARPVLFIDMIEEMVRLGATTFLEVGPGQVLTGLIRQILDDCSPTSAALACDTGKSDGSDLARVIARLAVLGHSIDLCQWDPQTREILETTDELAVMISGANLRPGEGTPRGDSPAPVAAPPDIESTKRQASTPALPANQALDIHQSQETLMQAIEQALQAQQNLAKAQEFAEDVLEKSLTGEKPTHRPTHQAEPPSIPSAQPEKQKYNPQPPQSMVEKIQTDTTPPITPESVDPEPASSQAIEDVIIDVVAEKTGYPASAIGSDLDLEADLGIDSIKRVEILSALREREPQLPAIPPEMLGTLRTIMSIVNWYQEQSPATNIPTSIPVEAEEEKSANSDVTGLTGEIPTEPLTTLIQEVVAEKTGYPSSAIGSQLDLESDLGIDSIKRVEILSALREKKPELPAIPPELLGTLRTIDAIVGWYSEQRTTQETTAETPVNETDETGTTPESSDHADLTDLIVEVVAEKTGYPASAIGTELDLEADLGIDSIKRVEILSSLRQKKPDLDAVPPELLGTLRTILSIVNWYQQNSPGKSLDSPVSEIPDPQLQQVAEISPDNSPDPQIIEMAPVTLERPRKTKPTISFEHNDLPFLVISDDPLLCNPIVDLLRSHGINANPKKLHEAIVTSANSDPLCGMVLIVDSTIDQEETILNCFRWLKTVGKSLIPADKPSGLITLVQRCDGQFGFSDSDRMNSDLAGAALSGLAKCAAREWPEALVRTIDLSPQFENTEKAARELVEEILHGRSIEIGLTPDARYSVDLKPTVFLNEPSPLMSPDATGTTGLVVVTGGARGVTASCVDAFAEKYKPKLLLLGRTPAPELEPEWCQDLPDEQIEQVLFQRKGTQETPAEIREEAQRILNGREISQRLRSLEAHGATVLYRSVDVRNRADLEQVIENARTLHGPVRGLIHGAGVLADSWIIDKTDQQFQQVWSTKVEPARHLLSICRDDELDFIAFFSSTTARLGRKGQSDYAASNEAINRLAQIESTYRRSCRIRSIGWGPWAGGMVDDSLRNIFHDEGVELIPLELGAKLFLKTLESGETPQCIILASLGDPTQSLQQFCQFPQDQNDSEVLPIDPATSSTASPLQDRGATIDISVDLIPALRHHVLGSRAVVPAVLLLEWCAAAATHRHPGLNLHGIDDFRVLKGVVLEHTSTQQICLYTGAPTADGSLLRVPVEIRSVSEDQRIHARAMVILGEQINYRSRLIAPVFKEDGDPGYGEKLFHGTTFQCIQNVSVISSDSISFRSEGAEPPETWFKNPMRSNWHLDPLHLDAVFQALILWSRDQKNSPCLPCGIDRLRCHQNLDPGLLETRIHVEKTAGSSAQARVEILNRSGIPAITIEGAEVIIDASLENAFKLDKLPEEASP